MSFSERGGNGFLRATINTPEPRASEWEISMILFQSPLKKSDLVLIEKKFKITTKQAASIAGVSVRAYQQWKPGTRLSLHATEHLLKIIEVYNSGMRTFDGSDRSFTAWIKSPINALGEKVPVSLMTSSKEDAELVNSELIRMEYGILS